MSRRLLLAPEFALDNFQLGLHARQLGLQLAKLLCFGRGLRGACTLAAGARFADALFDIGELFAGGDELGILVGVLRQVAIDLRFEVGFAFQQRAHRTAAAIICGHGGADDLLLLDDGFLLIGNLLLQGILAVVQLFDRSGDSVALRACAFGVAGGAAGRRGRSGVGGARAVVLRQLRFEIGNLAANLPRFFGGLMLKRGVRLIKDAEQIVDHLLRDFRIRVTEGEGERFGEVRVAAVLGFELDGAGQVAGGAIHVRHRREELVAID